jgi:hypothetical protein
MRAHRIVLAVGALAGLAALVAVIGCSSSKELKPLEDRKGFLSNYSALRLGKADEPLYVFRDKHANLQMFKKVILDPVQVWRGEESRREAVPTEHLQPVADWFYTLLYVRLARDYEMVTEPGPDVLRIRIALAKLLESNTTLEVTSTSRPQPNLVQDFREVAKTPPAFLGEGTLEVEFIDTLTGEVRFAGIERRTAVRETEERATWGDVERRMKFDAERLGYRLCVERGEKGCREPIP